MTTTLTVIFCLVLAAVVVGASTRPGKTLVGGVLQRDRKGRLVLILTPTRKKRGGRR